MTRLSVVALLTVASTVEAFTPIHHSSCIIPAKHSLWVHSNNKIHHRRLFSTSEEYSSSAPTSTTELVAAEETTTPLHAENYDSLSATTSVASVNNDENDDFFELEENKKVFHIGVLSLTTLWWYLYTSIDFFIDPTGFFDGFPQWAVYGLASYTTISQLIVYGCMWQLTNAPTLRRAQIWVVVCILLCVPADISVVLFDPTGSTSLTVLAFSLVTMVFALFFVHYVRLAAVREDRSTAMATGGIMNGLEKDGVMEMLNVAEPVELTTPEIEHEHHHALHPGGPLGHLQDYRPPRRLQSFTMAVDFTRSFVAFTIAMAGFRGIFSGEEGINTLVLASCAFVAVDTAVEMILTTVFPGSDIEHYKSWNMVEASASFIHIVSASIIGHEEAFGATIWDELLYSWLFGNAAAGFFESLNHLMGDFDFDSSLGLTKKLKKTVTESATSP